MNIISILQKPNNNNNNNNNNIQNTPPEIISSPETTTPAENNVIKELNNKISLKKHIMNNINIINSLNNNNSYINELYVFIKKDKKIKITENSNGVFFNLNSISEYRLSMLKQHTITILQNIKKLKKENDMLDDIKDDLNKYKLCNNSNKNINNNKTSLTFNTTNYSKLDKLIINYSLI
jgi:hypothetical protein